MIIETIYYDGDIDKIYINTQNEEKRKIQNNSYSVVFPNDSTLENEIEHPNFKNVIQYKVNNNYKIISKGIFDEIHWYTQPYYYNRSDWYGCVKNTI